MKEQGKTLAEAYGEIDKSIAFIDYMTSLSMSNKGEVLQNSVENEIIQITKKPIGVTAGIVLGMPYYGFNAKSYSRCCYGMLSRY